MRFQAETLRGMTLWAAYSNFEEKEVRGKWAEICDV
jgi:hypothetical protein